MKIVLSAEEIARFPTEINEFLSDYVTKRLLRSSDGHSGNLRLIKGANSQNNFVQSEDQDNWPEYKMNPL